MTRQWEDVMPISRIEVRKNWKAEEKQRLIETLHGALVAAFRIPSDDKLIRFVEYSPEDFVVPPGSTENYVLIELSIFPGRSLEAKRRLYRAIVDGFGKLGIAPMDIRIVLHEVPMDNWGIRGGVPASEVALGFDVKV
jgi:phenylpyruvate tautomerase PptA (4-oxalocrotonate tautomerase family)